jgi:hypothetical protein
MSKLKLTGPALLIALFVSFPALRDCLINHTLSTDVMLIRVGLAVIFAMAGVAWLSSVIDSYRLQNLLRRNREEAAAAAGARRTDDEPAKR